MMNILDQIMVQRKKDLADTMQRLPLGAIQESAFSQLPQMFDFKAAMNHKSREGINIIAEVKKASPSKGILCKNFKPLEIARKYLSAGAAALSILTEEKFFMGSKDYLQEISTSVNLPTLRKDFIIDAYQIYESRCLGANAFLLIVSCLSDQQLQAFIELGRVLELDALVEIHTKDELARALDCGAEIIGINNRDLNTFETSLETTFKIRPLIPGNITVVSESGISTAEHIKALTEQNVQAALIGESFMKDTDTIGDQMKSLLNH